MREFFTVAGQFGQRVDCWFGSELGRVGFGSNMYDYPTPTRPSTAVTVLLRSGDDLPVISRSLVRRPVLFGCSEVVGGRESPMASSSNAKHKRIAEEEEEEEEEETLEEVYCFPSRPSKIFFSL